MTGSKRIPIYIDQPGRVRVVLVWNSHTYDHYGNDRLDVDLDLCVYDKRNHRWVGCSWSMDNNYEVTEFTIWKPGYYDIYVLSYRFESSWEYYAVAWSNVEIHRFEGFIDVGEDSPRHEFFVPEHIGDMYVKLEMPFSGTDFDLSVWDPLDRRTGGWTRDEHFSREDIPYSQYSGYGADPEWVWVSPVGNTNYNWRTGCYAYQGDGLYIIKVFLT